MNSKLILSVVLLVGMCVPGGQAQLAITEVLSLASLEYVPNTTNGNRRPDYWELTNFGTNTINLDGYSFSDKKQKTDLHFGVFRGLSITGGQSIVFFRVPDDDRSSVTNVPRFREWWGDGLGSNVLLKTYKSPGLNGSYGDQVWVYDRQTNVVDFVTLGQARLGRSFTCENNTGIFGALSSSGVDGAFTAALGGDLGSPGMAIGPFSLDIARQPTDQTVDAGGEVTFSVNATGLPRPQYQWFYNGDTIFNATSPSLTIPELQPEHAGDYAVRIYNGLEEMMSDTAVLRVEIAPSAPVLLQAPVDLTVYPGQMAVFSARARGYPALMYQWQSNGVNILGAGGHTLVLSNASFGMSESLYTLQIWNDWGATNVSARLRVLPKPTLRFTETMGNPIWGDSSSHYDWFELTNGGTNTLDLFGYRFFDSLTFEGSWMISTPLYIRPGESVVFVEEMTPELFWTWWGPENGELGVQVYTYHGFSLGNLKGDIYLWNGAALDPLDTVSVSSWASLAVGISQECENWCDESSGCDGMCFMNSVLGLNGAYRAPVNGDIGSPGFVANPPPRILGVNHYGATVQLKCRVVPGKSYRLNSASSLGSNLWTERGAYAATGYLLWIDDSVLAGDPVRFYSLEEVR